MKQLFTSFLFSFFSVIAFCQSEALGINEVFENSQLADVLNMLKNKYELKIAYDYEAVRGINITKKIKTDDLETALKILFYNTNLEYKIADNSRILVRKKTQNYSSSKPIIHQYELKGKITDMDGGFPLAYATIYCPLTNQGTSCDEEGNFSLTLNSAKAQGTISIQYLGYIPRVMTWEKGQDLSDLQIQLKVKSLDFKEVTILEKLPVLSLNQEDGSILMRPSQIGTLPSFVGGNDIFRSIQLLPGISGTDDLSSELKIRGSSGDENMVILDGITLYKVDHYFGIFSAVNSNIINQAKIYKNAFPVEYGGRTAGVIDFSSHQIEKPQVHGILQADLLTSNAYITLPLNESMGLLLGGRTTNRNVADTDLFELLQTNQETSNAQNAPQITKGDPEFKFYDLNAKWLWNINSKSALSASFFRGYDKFKYDYIRVDTTRVFRPDQRRDVAVNTEFFEETAEWTNQGASLQFNHQWKPNLSSYINLAYSSYDDSQIINSTLTRVIERKPRPGSPPNTRPERRDTLLTLTNQVANTIEGLELNIKNEWQLRETQKITFGYHLVHNQAAFSLDVDGRRPLNENRDAFQHSAYVQYDIKTKQKFNFNLGLRNTFYTATNKHYLSPRLNITYDATNDLTLKAACSQYYQFLRKNYREDRFGVAYDFWVLSDGNPRRFPVASSKQCMLGFNFSKEGFEIDMEAYYKKMDGVTEFAPAQNGFRSGSIAPSVNQNYAFFNGTGIARGIDFLLKKSSGKYTGWLAYTLSKTTHSFPQINRGQAFPSQDDRRHELKLVNQYRYKKFDFAATVVYGSGRAYTDLEKVSGDQNRQDVTLQNRISYLPDYYRLDLGVNYNFNWGTSKARIGASVFNVFDRQNVKYRQYVYSIPNQRGDKNINELRGTDLLMLGFTPNVSFSVEF